MAKEGHENTRSRAEQGHINDLYSLKSLGDKFARIQDEGSSNKFRQDIYDGKSKPNSDPNMARPPHAKEKPSMSTIHNNGDAQYASPNIQKSKQAFVKTMENMGALLNRITFLEQRTSKIQDFCALQLSVFQLTLNTLTGSFNKNFEVNLSETTKTGSVAEPPFMTEGANIFQPRNKPTVQNLEETTNNIINDIDALHKGSTGSEQENGSQLRQPDIKKEKSQIENYLQMNMWTSSSTQQHKNNKCLEMENNSDLLEDENINQNNQIPLRYLNNIHQGSQSNLHQGTISQTSTAPTNKNKFSCSDCYFEAGTLQGLRLHVTKSHKQTKHRDNISKPPENAADMKTMASEALGNKKKRGRKSNENIHIAAITYAKSHSKEPDPVKTTNSNNSLGNAVDSTSFREHANTPIDEPGFEKPSILPKIPKILPKNSSKKLTNESLVNISRGTSSQSIIKTNEGNNSYETVPVQKEVSKPMSQSDKFVENMQTWIDDIEKLKASYTEEPEDTSTQGFSIDINLEEQSNLHKQPLNLSSLECDLCDYIPKSQKNANAKASLRMHIKSIHDKVKDHACTRCQYRTAQKGNLTQHCKKLHNGDGLPETTIEEIGKKKRGKSKQISALTYQATN